MTAPTARRARRGSGTGRAPARGCCRSGRRMATDRPEGRTDPRPSLQLVPPALTPAGPRKRPPGPLAVRRRYRLVQWASVAVGGFVAAVAIAAALADLTARKLVPDQVF